MADRFSADKKYADFLAKQKIPEVQMLQFNNEKNTQTMVYLFAMALGYQEGIRTPSEKKEGLILEHSFRNQDMALSLVYSIALQELRNEGRENEIDNTDVVFLIAEEYANTGFKKIEEMIPDFKNYDEETFELQLIELMDNVLVDI